MTFEEYWGDEPSPGRITAKDAWAAGQKAERERIKSQVKEAAGSLWSIRDQSTNKPDGLYIGPSLNTLEQFVEKLMGEE